MTDPQMIRDVFERHVQVLASRPARGQLTFTTTARLVDGLRCEISEGAWRFAADVPVKLGGDDTAPNPGVLGRGALASCLVITISRWAARRGIPIDALEVEVAADLDARGELGIADEIPPGYGEIRYTVSVRSPASLEAITEVLAEAERHTPYLDNFGRAVPLRGIRRINCAGA
jgi:uncharacterized OsmC-like protein